MTITVGGTSITFNDATTQSTAAASPTTANVLAATAGASVGAVGTYALAGFGAGSNAIIPGGTAAGSSLRYFGLQTSDGAWTQSRTVVGTGQATALSGTWRAMGFSQGQTNAIWGATLWLRIS